MRHGQIKLTFILSEVSMLCTGRLLAAAVVAAVGCVYDAVAQGNSEAAAYTDTRDGKTYGPVKSSYKSVTIGGKKWMKRNLNIKTENSWCYKDNEIYCDAYGRLYTWEAAKSACSLAGSGWRLPLKTEWDSLVSAAGGSSVAGKNLKAKNGWMPWYGVENLDTYGFSALPGGHRDRVHFYLDGSHDSTVNFNGVGFDGYWWTATEGGSDRAYGQTMEYSDGKMRGFADYRCNAHSVRCVKDARRFGE
jgi:uncharacterized protein (TIGR02145 family)